MREMRHFHRQRRSQFNGFQSIKPQEDTAFESLSGIKSVSPFSEEDLTEKYLRTLLETFVYQRFITAVLGFWDYLQLNITSRPNLTNEYMGTKHLLLLYNCIIYCILIFHFIQLNSLCYLICLNLFKKVNPANLYSKSLPNPHSILLNIIMHP